MKNPAAVALGHLGGLKGGKVKSEAKAAAARRNGRKGGATRAQCRAAARARWAKEREKKEEAK